MLSYDFQFPSISNFENRVESLVTIGLESGIQVRAPDLEGLANSAGLCPCLGQVVRASDAKDATHSVLRILLRFHSWL